MGLLERLRLRQAAKTYARKLGPHLQRAYGASEHYSAGQIRTGVDKLRLDPKFIIFAYAAFLPAVEYEKTAAKAPLYLPYAEALELFARFRPARRSGGSDYYESGIATVGHDLGHGGSS